VLIGKIVFAAVVAGTVGLVFLCWGHITGFSAAGAAVVGFLAGRWYSEVGEDKFRAVAGSAPVLVREDVAA
jgi:hypothetical protein